MTLTLNWKYIPIICLSLASTSALAQMPSNDLQIFPIPAAGVEKIDCKAAGPYIQLQITMADVPGIMSGGTYEISNDYSYHECNAIAARLNTEISRYGFSDKNTLIVFDRIKKTVTNTTIIQFKLDHPDAFSSSYIYGAFQHLRRFLPISAPQPAADFEEEIKEGGIAI